jgi:hypothetical protein
MQVNLCDIMTQVGWSRIPTTLIGWSKMCSLLTIFALIVNVRMFLQILMVMRKSQRGGIQMGRIDMLKDSRWVWEMMLL